MINVSHHEEAHQKYMWSSILKYKQIFKCVYKSHHQAFTWPFCYSEQTLNWRSSSSERECK